MKRLMLLLCAVALVGCGADTASTALAIATAKKHEMENGQKTINDTRQKLNDAAQEAQQNQDRALGEEK